MGVGTKAWKGLRRGALLAAVAVGFLAVETAARAQTYGAEISSYSTDEFLVSTWIPVTLKVKNLGLSGNVKVMAIATPYGWSVKAGEGSGGYYVSHWIRQGSKESFTFLVSANPNQATGNITWEVWGTDVNDFPILLLQETQGVQAVYPPGPFQTLAPTPGQTDVSTSPTFYWQDAEGAELYWLELFNDVGGLADDSPFFTSTVLQTTSLVYSGGEPLKFQTRYWWQVTAHNQYSNTMNSSGKRLFTTRPMPTLTAFNIVSPSYNGQYDMLPNVMWTASGEASYYEIKVFEDDNGVRGEQAGPTRYVSTTYWDWAWASIVKGRNYWVDVVARGESAFVTPVRATNSPVRFLYSGLYPFGLISPYLYQEDVALQPLFEWDYPNGSKGCRLELRGADALNSGYRYSALVPSGSRHQYEGLPLLPNARYQWTVYSLGTGEELIAQGGFREFRTVDVQPFLLGKPGYDESAVDRHPLFTWEPVRGTDVDSLVLQVWEEHPMIPGQLVHMYSSFPALASTATSHRYQDGLPLQPGVRYHWRVLAYKGEEVVRINEGGFRPLVISHLRSFNLVSPYSGETGIALKPTFQWESSPTTDKYTLVIWLASPTYEPVGFPITVIDDIPATATSMQYGGHPALTGLTRYAWQVYAWEGDYFMSSSSQPFGFEVKTYNAFYGYGVPEYILGQGRLMTPSSVDEADQNGDGVIDISDIILWQISNSHNPRPAAP